MMHTYDDGIETYKLEDGHFSTNSEISVAELQKIADQEDSDTAKATIYKQYFYNFDYTFEGNSNYSIRLYENREALNTYSIFEGHAPRRTENLPSTASLQKTTISKSVTPSPLTERI